MTINRRSFLQEASLAVSASSIFALPVLQSPNAMFSHHVLFWLKDNGDRQVYNKVLKALQNFKTVPQVKFLHVGAPSISDVDYEAAATDDTFTLSYLTLFNNKKEKEEYLKHPLHAQFFAEFKDVVLKVVIYDSLAIA